MRIKMRILRETIRRILLEQVVGYKAPQDSASPHGRKGSGGGEKTDYLQDASISAPSEEGSREDVEASQDAVKSLTQQRQAQMNKGDVVGADESGRELSATRKMRG